MPFQRGLRDEADRQDPREAREPVRRQDVEGLVDRVLGR